MFRMSLPTEFKYEKVDGIDSFVGEINNGKSTFFFDYGWYSPSPPMDRKSFIEESKQNMDLETLLKFMNQIDLKPYENEKGEVSPLEISRKIKNLTLHKMSENIIADKEKESICGYYYALEFDEKKYYVSFCIPNEQENQFKYYELDIDTIGGYKRTIAIWTDKQHHNISSVHFEPIKAGTNANKLSIGIKSSMEFDKNQLKTIFENVTLK